MVHKFIFFITILKIFLKSFKFNLYENFNNCCTSDDEILGIGGSIAKWAASGNKVDVKILAEGSTSRDLKRDSKLRQNDILNLRSCAEKASNILGVNSLQMFGFPDNRMDSLDFLDIVKVIEEQVQKHEPQIIVTHHFGDLNIDHKIIHNAVVTAARPQPDSQIREEY